MNEMIFLYVLGAMVTIVAIIQDLKDREVANWLNFNFIAVGLSYRAFYASVEKDFNFFLYGILGFGFMFVLAYLLYYGRAFAGGDAKLLMGFGAILPYTSFKSVFGLGLGFIFLVFLAGFIWTLLYSFYFVRINRKRFFIEFNKNWRRYGFFVILAVAVFLISLFLYQNWIYLGGLLLFLSVIWVYVKSLDEIMKVERSVGELREGDWLEEDVNIGNRWIRMSVHGLSLKEIKLIKNNSKTKKILIKDGIPFTPAFLMALGIMVFFWKVLLYYFEFLKGLY